MEKGSGLVDQYKCLLVMQIDFVYLTCFDMRHTSWKGGVSMTNNPYSDGYNPEDSSHNRENSPDQPSNPSDFDPYSAYSGDSGGNNQYPQITNSPYPQYSFHGSTPNGSVGGDQTLDHGAQSYGWAMAGGSSTVNIGQAISFGFKVVFVQPAVWLLGTVVVGIVYFVSLVLVLAGYQLITGTDPLESFLTHTYEPVQWLLFGLPQPIFCAAGLIQLDGYKITTKGITQRLGYLRSLGTHLLASAALFGIILIIDYMQNDVYSLEEVTLVTTLVKVFVPWAGLVIASILLTFSLPFAVDGRAFYLEAIKQSVTVAARVFLPLFAFHMLLLIINIAALFLTCGVALIITIPATFLAILHMYRQASGGVYPVV